MRCWSRRSSTGVAALCAGGLILWWTHPALAAESASAQALGWLGAFIHERGLLVGLLAVFVVGLGLNLTPCVYPIMPVTLAFFSQQSSGSAWRTAALAFLYVIGMSLSYAVLGVVTASAGALLGSWLQHPAVLVVIAAMIVALAMSMFGLYDFRLPSLLTDRLGQASSGALGAFSMGLVFGLVAAPCIGPFVGGLVLFVVEVGKPVLGFLLFFVLGLGMGLPYLILGVAAHKVSRLPKAGAWLIWSKKALGVILLGLALYFLKPLIPAHLLWPAVAVLLGGAGLYLGWLDTTVRGGRRFRWIRRFVGAALVVSAVVVVWPRSAGSVPRVSWQPYTEAALEEAQRAGHPILIDIYADWCLPCVEMDHVTFRHPDVVRALASVTTLRLDVTSEISKEGEALVDRYKIYGAPTILLFDRSGTERKALRILGFTPSDEFLERLRQLQ